MSAYHSTTSALTPPRDGGGPRLWDPSRVLDPDPCQDMGRCIGFAVSKGRRCLVGIAWERVEEAEQRLEELARTPLDEGERVRELLEVVAGCLLCVDWHRWRKREVVEGWMRQVEEEKRAREARRIQNRRRAAAMPRESSPDNSSPAAATTTATSTTTRGREEDQARTERSAPATPPRTPTRASPPTTTPSPPTASIPAFRASSSSPPPRSQSAPSRPLTHQPAQPAQPPPTPPTAQRKPINPNQECAICKETLLPDDDKPVRLVWCRAVCGQSLHAECWREWERAQTCQTETQTQTVGGRVQARCANCRGVWVN